MRIAIVTDTWTPHANSIVATLEATQETLRNAGHDVHVLGPEDLPTFACPLYPEIRLARKPGGKVEPMLDTLQPDAIHIATPGPMGLAGRSYCIRHGLDFTTSFHARLPEYVRRRSVLPLALSYRWLKWFHGRSKAVMVPTPALKQTLDQRGFGKLALWEPGIDTMRFSPDRRDCSCIERPLHLYVGRISAERNVEDFLRLDVPGSKWVIGDGPQRDRLEQRYPSVRFLGPRRNEELAPYYNCADVLVYPGLIGTSGLVMLEAMACGVPVAAYPVQGPGDRVANGASGMLDYDLARACANALLLSRKTVREHAMRFSWSASAQQFMDNLRPARGHERGYAMQSQAS